MNTQSDISKIKEINIYKWSWQCYRCYDRIPVVSYYFFHGHFHGIGDVPKLDEMLKNQYLFVKEVFNKKTRQNIVINHCSNCEIQVDNQHLMRNFVKKIVPDGVEGYVDTSFGNTLTLNDLKTKIYEKLGLTKEEAAVLEDLERILGYPLFISKGITGLIEGMKIENGHVESLSFFGCSLKSLPDSIGNLRNLKSLNLRGNKLKELPASFKELQCLETLDLAQTPLRPFPPQITQLKSLKKLSLVFNNFESIPDSIENLNSLEDLAIHSLDQLPNIPDSIGNLTSLRKLSLWGAKIGKIPESIGNLNNLEVLRIKIRDLTFIPESFGKLTSLKELDIPLNDLIEIPVTVRKILEKIESSKEVLEPFIKEKKTHSTEVEVSFEIIQMDEKLRKYNKKRAQEEDIEQWEWESSKWERDEYDIIFHYDEIFIIPSVEIQDFSNFPQGELNQPLPNITKSRWLKLKRSGGIRVSDLKEAYLNHLPDYGDYHFFETLRYMYDYDGIPVFYLFIGS